MKSKANDITISVAMKLYIDMVKLSRSEHTARAYQNALNTFKRVLVKQSLNPATHPIEKISEDFVAPFAAHLKTFSPATEQMYLQAVTGFYRFLAAENLSIVNLPRIALLIKQRSRRPGIRLPQFPSNDIEKLLDTLLSNSTKTDDVAEKIRILRDRAFLLMLADTGLRVHEACKLRRGDVDWNEGRAVIIGKGNKQAVVRFSTRCMDAIKDYLQIRAQLDGASGKQLASLPLFARHDKGAGKKIISITPTTGRNIVAERVSQFLGSDSIGKITPHSFRHYFVTTVLRGSGNLKLAQELARHKNIQITQRYAHLSDDELDKGYYDIFEKKDK